MKILVGVDGSPGGFEAVRQAAQLSHPSKDDICLYYSPPELKAKVETEPAVLERARAAMTKVVFDAAKEQMPEAWRSEVTTLPGRQHPRTGLMLAADEWRAELIVVGARGVGPIERLMLGSVSRHIAHSATIPVLVARARVDLPKDAPYRVLVACEGTEADNTLAEWLHRFSWPGGSIGQLMHVVESMTCGEIPPWLAKQTRSAEVESMAQAWEREHEHDKSQMRDKMLEFSKRLPAPFQCVEPIIREGHPAQQILEASAANPVDLIVIGARGLNLVERWLIGSTSEKVLAEAACSVLIVRRHEQP